MPCSTAVATRSHAGSWDPTELAFRSVDSYETVKSTRSKISPSRSPSNVNSTHPSLANSELRVRGIETHSQPPNRSPQPHPTRLSAHPALSSDAAKPGTAEQRHGTTYVALSC
jgi:hypothetical protein